MTLLVLMAAALLARYVYFNVEFSYRAWNQHEQGFYAIYWKRSRSFSVKRNPRKGWYISRHNRPVSALKRIFELTEILFRGILMTVSDLIDDRIVQRQ